MQLDCQERIRRATRAVGYDVEDEVANNSSSRFDFKEETP